MESYRDNPNVNVHQFEDDYESYDDYGGDLPPPRGSVRRGSSNSNLNASSSSRVHPLQSGNGDPDDKNLIVDFDAFSSDAEKLSAILKCADVEQHKHMLAVDYFRFRKYGILVPTVVMSLTIAVCGFVAASDIMKDHMKVHDASAQDFLTLMAASFGFLVLLLTILGNGLDFNSGIGFHRAAAEDLEGLCDRVRLYRMERAMDERNKEEDEELKDLFDDEDGTSTESDESDEENPSVSRENQIIPHTGNQALVKKQMKQKMKQTKRMQKRTEKLTKTLVKQKVRQAREEQELSKDVITFYGYHTELHQIRRGCRSDVPPEIAKFFQVMENRVELMSLSRLGVEEESRMRKNQIVRLCANEIYNEISSFSLWPLLTPGVDGTVETSLKRVGQLLNMNYRAQRRCKLIPCCPIPLCCKKKTTNNVFAIINEGIDQRELDMMQAERVELVKMENERRARRNAGPEEVLEMRDTMYSDGGARTGKRKAGGTRAAPPPEAASVITEPEYYAPADRSRMSRDPDGETYNDMATEASNAYTEAGNTEASYSFRGGGYAGHHFSPKGAKGGGGLYPQDREDYMSNSGMITEEDATYQGSFQGTYETAQSDTDEEGTLADDDEGTRTKKSKKKKKKKSKKKKKKKSKKKQKQEEEFEGEDYTEYSEEEYSDGFTEDEYSEYSEGG